MSERSELNGASFGSPRKPLTFVVHGLKGGGDQIAPAGQFRQAFQQTLKSGR